MTRSKPDLGRNMTGADRIVAIALSAMAMPGPAAAFDNREWGDRAPAVHEWFRSLMQPDNPQVSCCGEADAFEADRFEAEGDHYVAIITDGRGIFPTGLRVRCRTRR